MDKEFSKLTHEQFAHFISKLPEVRGQMRELPDALRSRKERLQEIFADGDYSWGMIYERPFLEQIAVLLVLTGLHEPLQEAVQSSDPQETVVHWGDDGSPLDQWLDAHEQQIEKRYLIWLSIVLQRNILSIMLFQKSMGALVEEVRQGSDAALFQAVRVDRSVLLAAPCASRWSLAEMTNDKNFLRHLRSAMKGPSQKHMAAIQDLRYSIVALRECGFDQFSDAQLERLFISTKLYPNSPGALKNLRKHIQNARKITTT